ncbi:hypothetical protein BpHYR1_043868 [Brachionus plicatilis]|uniref:Uncharacterized protein n=1 Tax=Brachionus plicatilis TaxID=10195 RepID=A0A3M7S9H4_BRAPC|nr:hypothetical protein BpHYR1_043868 [Brachionus plicatilis]
MHKKILANSKKIKLKGLRFGLSFRFISQNKEIQNRGRTVSYACLNLLISFYWITNTTNQFIKRKNMNLKRKIKYSRFLVLI